MKQTIITIKGQEIGYYNFGKNNYSYNLEPCTFDPIEISAEEVAKIPGFFLHPSMEPTTHEIYALKGTYLDYLVFLKRVVEIEAAAYANDLFHIEDEWEQFKAASEEYKANYRPWFWKE